MYSFIFSCGNCQYQCQRNKVKCPKDQELWNCISQSDTAATVICPSCREEIEQCCHCTYGLVHTDVEAMRLKKSRKKSFRKILEQHVKQHMKRKIEYSSPEFEFDCGDSQDGPLPILRPRFHSNSLGDSECSMGSIRPGDDLTELFDVEIETVHSISSEEDGEFTMDDPEDDSIEGDPYGNAQRDDNDDYEIEMSAEYVNTFLNLDLDPNKVEDINEDDYDGMLPTFDVNDDGGNEVGYSYEDFNFFDTRKKEEKSRPRSSIERISQVQLYFWQKYKAKCLNKDDDMGGFRGLVGRSNVRDREDINIIAAPEEANTMFTLFDMVMNMTEKMQEKVVLYNRRVFELFRIGELSNNVMTRFPTTISELKTGITKGAHSIMKNFPVQRVFDVGGHACVGLQESFRISAGHGVDHNWAINGSNGETNSEGLNGTKAMSDLIEDIRQSWEDAGVSNELRVKTKVGYLLFWSDSFLRCFIKQKDNSIWILTVTVCPPEHMKSSSTYTYILAMGKSSEDHTPVVEHYMKEVSELMKGFDCYFGSTNKMERVALGMITWNADRPENQMLTMTRKEGNYGKVTGMSVNVSEQYHPACVDCFLSSIQNLAYKNNNASERTACRRCCNWSFTTQPVAMLDGDPTNLQCRDKTCKDYPKSYPLTMDNIIQRGDLSGSQPDNLTTDIEPMPPGRTSGLQYLGPVKLNTEWVTQAVRSGYFGVRLGGWSKTVARQFFATCNIKTLTGDKAYDAAVRDIESGVINPGAVEPQFWKLTECFRRFRFPNLPLHGIFHGMAKDVMEILHRIFSKYKKMSDFYKYANIILDDVATFGLDWCKCKQLPKKSWVGEHTLAFTRLMSYLYGSFLMNNSLGNSDEAKITVDYIKCMVNSFQSILSILMSKKIANRETINSHMKLFMSSTHYLHKAHGNLDKEKSDENGPGHTSKKKTSFLSTLPTSSLQTIADELGKDKSGTKQVLKSRIEAIVKRDLIQEMLKWGNLTSSKRELEALTKEDLYKEIVHNKVVGNDGDNNAAVERQTKSETMCWNKGNWVSFTENIADQIDYLGNLHLIW